MSLSLADIRAAVERLHAAPSPAFKKHGAYLMPVHPANVPKAIRLHQEGKLVLVCTSCGGPLEQRGPWLVCSRC